jgi:Zn-dependent peptidase ImmA (M78 family)
MLTPVRKKAISDLANTISMTFFTKNLTDLEAMAIDEEIFYYFDHYEDSFDGMLIYDNEHFHIHINIDRGNTKNSKKGRFTFAHELGHYFIDEHRTNLKKGLLKPHSSIYHPNQKELIELEADYFAGCLLMPDYRFKKANVRRKFSLDTIFDLSEEFQSSILATVLRFAEIGTHPVTVVLSENNIVKWYSQSYDFPKWSFKFKVGTNVPPTTVAGEFFTRRNAKYTDVEDLDVNDWFHSIWMPRTQMHEQCYFSNSYGYVISIIWFD